MTVINCTKKPAGCHNRTNYRRFVGFGSFFSDQAPGRRGPARKSAASDLASGISPFLFGKVFDVTGSYQPILYLAAVLFVVGAVALLTLGRYPRFDDGTPAATRG